MRFAEDDAFLLGAPPAKTVFLVLMKVKGAHKSIKER